MMADYKDAWAIFRRRNRTAILWLLLGLPSFGALSVASAVAFGTKTTGPMILFVLMAFWSAIFLVLGFRVTRLKCPRCGGVFFSHAEIVHTNTRYCAKCGLKLYSDGTDAGPNHTSEGICQPADGLPKPSM
jgi:ribosomal protein S27AE